MNKLLCLALCFAALAGRAQQNDSATIRHIFNEELRNGQAYPVLDHLSNSIGGRLSGSPQAQQAVEYMQKMLRNTGADTVWLQEVMVPHWVRGEKEQAEITMGKEKLSVRICALGNSVGTGSKGISGEVIEVHGLKELEALGTEKIKGRIVFFNRPMDPTLINTGSAYGGAVDQRGLGASEAAKFGAIGVVVRSMSLAIDDHPHTGQLRYGDTMNKIPACAISTKGAGQLSSMLSSGKPLRFWFRQTCQMLPEVKSYNVVAEIRGSEHPEEIIAVGGHLDSWDTGDGSHDDGTGCVQGMDVLRIFRQLGLRPKRTVRCVLFMNEENGLRGGMKYAELAQQLNEKNIAAIESDGGGFTPRSFSVEDNASALAAMQAWVSLLKPYGIHEIVPGHGGSDIGPLKKLHTVLIGYNCDSQRYFDYHHTEADTFDKVNKRELELGAACMASLVWLLSEHGI